MEDNAPLATALVTFLSILAAKATRAAMSSGNKGRIFTAEQVCVPYLYQSRCVYLTCTRAGVCTLPVPEQVCVPYLYQSRCVYLTCTRAGVCTLPVPEQVCVPCLYQSRCVYLACTRGRLDYMVRNDREWLSLSNTGLQLINPNLGPRPNLHSCDGLHHRNTWCNPSADTYIGSGICLKWMS